MFNYGDLMFLDDEGGEYKTGEFEVMEQMLAYKFIQKTDNVLELGCRFGTNSCLISVLCNKLVAIDPCKSAVDTCIKNMNRYGFNFICEWCTVSKNSQVLNINKDATFASYTSDGTSDIPNYTMKDLEEKHSMKFNTIVADCEGCLEKFVTANDISNITKIIYEQDNECMCDYSKVESLLTMKGMRMVEKTYDGLFRKVWII